MSSGKLVNRSSDRPASGLALLASGSGRVVVAGDSNCLDSSHVKKECFNVLSQLLEFAIGVRARWGRSVLSDICGSCLMAVVGCLHTMW